jgi:hypothetical protein
MIADKLRTVLPGWLVDLTPFGAEPAETLIIYSLVLLVAIISWHVYHAARYLKTGATGSDLFSHEQELGRKADGHWRREQLRRFGALRPRHHHSKRHRQNRRHTGFIVGAF